MLALVLPNVLLASAPLLASAVPPTASIQSKPLRCNEAIIESRFSLPFGSMLSDFTGPCAVISRYRLEAYATLLLCLAEDEFEDDLVATTPR